MTTTATNHNGGGGGGGECHVEKITMNLKMDDLLASVRNEATYETLADFSVMTGENDSDMGHFTARRHPSNINNKPQKHNKSKTTTTLGDGGGGLMAALKNSLKVTTNGASSSSNNQNADDDDDDDDDDAGDGGDDDQEGEDDQEDDASTLNRSTKLAYKYTATYRKDEATGDFKEQSKIVFENKSGSKAPLRPPPPPPAAIAMAALHSSSKPSPPPPPPPPSQAQPSQAPAKTTFASVFDEQPKNTSTSAVVETLEAGEEEEVEASPDAKAQLAMALQALMENSKRLETIGANDHVDLLLLTNDTSKAPKRAAPPLPSATAATASATATTAAAAANDSFFYDFLNKSDSLLAQTQQKLERLSKLDSMNKPAAPSPPPPPPPPPPPTLPQPTQTTLSVAIAADLINSKSLIDLKSTQSQTNIPAAANANTNSQQQQQQQQQAPSHIVDLVLFDVESSEQNAPTDAVSSSSTSSASQAPTSAAFTLSTEPLKQGASYFDLIGLHSDAMPQPPPLPSTHSERNPMDELAELMMMQPSPSPLMSMSMPMPMPMSIPKSASASNEHQFAAVVHESEANAGFNNESNCANVEAVAKRNLHIRFVCFCFDDF